MRIIILTIICCLFYCVGSSQDHQLQSLKETYATWIQAWNDKNAKTVTKISWGSYGFGRDVPFQREGTTDSLLYMQNIQNYMDTMSVIDYKEYYTKYEIIDAVGLVSGFYAQTTQQKNGPLRTVYGRQTLVFVREHGNWKMKHYHRSLLPNEFIR